MSLPVRGGRGGSDQRFDCPPGQLLTGVTIRSGKVVDGITGARCQNVEELLDSSLPQQPTTHQINIGGGGGSSNWLYCDPGSAINTMSRRWGGVIDAITFTCKNLKNGAMGQPGYWGGPGGNQDAADTCSQNSYIGSLVGRGGSRLDAIGAECRNVGELISTYNDKKKQEQCCFGELTSAAQCGSQFNPNSARCKNIIRDFCKRGKNMLQEKCKKWAGNLNNADEDAVWRNFCDANKNEEQCRCFYPKVSENLKQLVPELPQCFDPICVSNRAYKPHSVRGTACPNVCAQVVDVAQTGDQVNTLINDNQFSLTCGQETVEKLKKKKEDLGGDPTDPNGDPNGDPTGDPTPTGGPTTDPIETSSGGMSTTTKVLLFGGIGLVLLIVFIIVGFLIFRSTGSGSGGMGGNQFMQQQF
jgi:hypothetical protein